MPILNKDMQVCMSLAARPSNIGTRFHNFLYDELGLNFIYKAFTTTDLEGAVRGIRALGIRGCSVSMPFKEAIIPLVDVMEPSASPSSPSTPSSTTTVCSPRRTPTTRRSPQLLDEHEVDPAQRVLLRGSGGMAKAVVAAFRGAGFDDVTMLARNEAAGPALADRYDYAWVADEPEPDFDVIVNVTPLGMRGDAETCCAFSPEHIERASTVFDVVAFPSETPLVAAARAAGKKLITGAEVIALQAARAVRALHRRQLTAGQVARASEFSRAE